MKRKVRVYNLSLIFIVLLQGWALSLKAQQDSSSVSINKAYFHSLLLDSRDLVIAPVHWKSPQWLSAGVVVGGTSLLLWQDQEALNWIQKGRTSFTADASTYFFEPMGRGILSFPVVGAFGLHGWITGNERSKRVALLSSKALALSGLTVTALKLTFERHRPYQDNPSNPYHWEGPVGKFSFKSFPSGHSITIFTIAGMLATEYRDKPIIPVIAYTIAGLSALSRVLDNKHWTSDVFMGAALGISISRMVYFRNNWKIRIKERKRAIIAID